MIINYCQIPQAGMMPHYFSQMDLKEIELFWLQKSCQRNWRLEHIFTLVDIVQLNPISVMRLGFLKQVFLFMGDERCMSNYFGEKLKGKMVLCQISYFYLAPYQLPLVVSDSSLNVEFYGQTNKRESQPARCCVVGPCPHCEWQTGGEIFRSPL